MRECSQEQQHATRKQNHDADIETARTIQLADQALQTSSFIAALCQHGKAPQHEQPDKDIEEAARMTSNMPEVMVVDGV
jgi:hypothetical protein